MECEKKLNKLKNRLTKIHDKIQSKVDYLCEDLHEVVHHGFKSHVKNSSNLCLYERVCKNKLNIHKKSTSLECLQIPDLSENCEYKIKFFPNESKKINLIASAPFSKSAQSLLEFNSFAKNDIPIITTENSLEVSSMIESSHSSEFIKQTTELNNSDFSSLSHSSNRFVFF